MIQALKCTIVCIFDIFQLLQVFESHGDFFNTELFKEYSLKYFKQISERVKQKLDVLNIPKVPMASYPINS